MSSSKRIYATGVAHPRFIDLTGQTLGYWTIVSLKEIRDKKSRWNCVCKCGNTGVLTSGNLRNGSTNSCGCYRKDSPNRPIGARNAMWNPDRDKQKRSKDRLGDPAYKDWRKRVFARDGHICQISGQKGGDLAAHHLEAWGICPEKRYVVDNGVTMSRVMHIIFHRMFGQGRNTREQFDQFARWMHLVDEKVQYPFSFHMSVWSLPS